MTQILQTEEQISDRDEILKLRKTQMYKKWHTDENTKRLMRSKKPFPKFGIILSAYSIINLILVEYGPWGHLKAQWITGYQVDDLIFKNLRGINPYVLPYFERPFGHIHGIFSEDFSQIPTLVSYSLIVIFCIGILITIYGLMDRKNNYGIIKFYEKQSYLYLSSIIPCVVIIVSCLPFIGSYIILGHNVGYLDDLILVIEGAGQTVPAWTPPVPYMLIISTFFIITIAFTVLDSNLRTIRKDIKISKEKMIGKTRIIPTKKDLLNNKGKKL